MSQTPPPPEPPTQLIVFADDWGRHPSSSQHLVGQLLPGYPTLWVNTVGTRRPRLNLADLRRVWAKLRSGARPGGAGLPEGLAVISPAMYPGFRTSWQRRFNTRQVVSCVSKATAPGRASKRVAITTLPITADLVGKLDVDRWVYYCVDDYSKWPGTDHAVMDAMERELVAKADAVVCVSETLQDRIASMGRSDAALLTHGVDVDYWASPPATSNLSPWWTRAKRPVILFWGLIDERLDLVWLDRLAAQCASEYQVFAAGPRSASGRGAVAQVAWGDVDLIGPIAYEDLAAHAWASEVLIMPYIDAPVTRAMQPLKLKEYLATMKPVVVRDLPSTRQWADCCDLASTAEAFVELVLERARSGVPAEQLEARRRRLPGESWAHKAGQLADIIKGG